MISTVGKLYAYESGPVASPFSDSLITYVSQCMLVITVPRLVHVRLKVSVDIVDPATSDPAS